MDFIQLTDSARKALYSAESQAKINYNENALAKVAFGYSVLALAEAIYYLSTAVNDSNAAKLQQNINN